LIEKDNRDQHPNPDPDPDPNTPSPGDELPGWAKRLVHWTHALDAAADLGWKYFSETAIYAQPLRLFIGKKRDESAEVNSTSMKNRQKVLNGILLKGSDIQSMTGISPRFVLE
jgi:hypothetical protein